MSGPGAAPARGGVEPRASAEPFPDLADLDSAEDFFDALGVAYERSVLDVARLHVLRAFGQAREEIDRTPGLDPDDRLRRYREALLAAHDCFTRQTPRDARLFGCLQDRSPVVTLGRRR